MQWDGDINSWKHFCNAYIYCICTWGDKMLPKMNLPKLMEGLCMPRVDIDFKTQAHVQMHT